MGVPRFLNTENLRSQVLEGTYNGQPSNFEFHLYLAISGRTMLELIQPVSGKSIYTDFLDRHKNGGIQHIAYVVQVAEFDDTLAELLILIPIKNWGVATEIIGLTNAGNQLMEQLNTGNY